MAATLRGTFVEAESAGTEETTGFNLEGVTLVEADPSTLSFGRPSTETWATGYRDESDWVAISEVKDERGRFIHQRGISPVPHLYFIGRSWRWTRGSALLVGVGAGAAYLTEHIVKHLDESAVA